MKMDMPAALLAAQDHGVADEASLDITQGTVLFVDADNQTASLASALANFLDTMDCPLNSAVIAGNSNGEHVRHWTGELKSLFPEAKIEGHVTSSRKQSADVRLMFAIARIFHSPPDPTRRIIIVSRDDLLIAAADALIQAGHKVLMAVSGAAPALPAAHQIPVALLYPPTQATTHRTPELPITTSEPAPKTAPPSVSRHLLHSVVEQIKRDLKRTCDGAYLASDVGGLLAGIGYDKAFRRRIILSIPGLQQIGAGGTLRFKFQS